MFKASGFNAFRTLVEQGGVVRAIPVGGIAAQPRSFFDKLVDYAKAIGSKGLAYLVWTDAAGAVNANPALVNDLDLEVDHAGNTYLGNVLNDMVRTDEAIASFHRALKFDPDLADLELGDLQQRVGGLQRLKVLVADRADIAHHVREIAAHGIVARESDLGGDAGDHVGKDEFYELFARFCRENRITPVPERKAVTIALKTRFALSETGADGSQVWTGIRVK